MIASPAEANAWKVDDLAYLEQLASAALRRLRIDGSRVVISGQGQAGQLAFAVAMRRRTACSGVIGIDAPLPRTLKLRDTTPGNRLAVLSIESRNSNFAPLIRRDVKQLREAGYPTSWLQRPPTGDVTEELDAATRDKLARWIDGLDRLSSLPPYPRFTLLPLFNLLSAEPAVCSSTPFVIPTERQRPRNLARSRVRLANY